MKIILKNSLAINVYYNKYNPIELKRKNKQINERMNKRWIRKWLLFLLVSKERFELNKLDII